MKKSPLSEIAFTSRSCSVFFIGQKLDDLKYSVTLFIFHYLTMLALPLYATSHLLLQGRNFMFISLDFLSTYVKGFNLLLKKKTIQLSINVYMSISSLKKNMTSFRNSTFIALAFSLVILTMGGLIKSRY